MQLRGVTRGVSRMAAYRRESTGTDKLSEKMDMKGYGLVQKKRQANEHNRLRKEA
jgi:hypothetical protein